MINPAICLAMCGIFATVIGFYWGWKRSLVLLYQAQYEVRGKAAIAIGLVWIYGGIMIMFGSLIGETSIAGLMLAAGIFPIAISIFVGHFIKKPINKRKAKPKNEAPITNHQKAK